MTEEMPLVDAFLELYKRTACTLPKDVLKALKVQAEEQKGSEKAKQILRILEEVRANGDKPLKPDPVTAVFYIRIPEHWSMVDVADSIKEATKKATEKGYLPHAMLDVKTDKKCPGNIGHGSPQLQVREWVKEHMEVMLILQSGESQNASIQYSLPDASIKAKRDLDGVHKCVIDCVKRAHTLHWPAFLGIAIGGDRTLSRLGARKQLFRKMEEPNEDTDLDKLEKDLAKHEDIASANITTFTTLPTSFFVTIEYAGWTCRRQGFTYSDGVVHEWID